MNKDLEILRKSISDLQKENTKLTNERDKACKDYLKLYERVENTKKLINDLIKAQKYKIKTNKYIYIHLEELGDLQEILYTLEKR